MYLVTIKEYISELKESKGKRIPIADIEKLQSISTGVIDKMYDVDLFCVPEKGGSFEVHASNSQDKDNESDVRFIALSPCSISAIATMNLARESFLRGVDFWDAGVKHKTVQDIFIIHDSFRNIYSD